MKDYESPELDIIYLEDIVTASGSGSGGNSGKDKPMQEAENNDGWEPLL